MLRRSVRRPDVEGGRRVRNLPRPDLKARDRAKVVHDASAGARREDAIGAAIEIKEFAGRVDAQASGIRNPRVAAKDTERVTVKIEGKGRSVTVAAFGGAALVSDDALFAHKGPTLVREASERIMAPSRWSAHRSVEICPRYQSAAVRPRPEDPRSFILDL